MAGLEGVETPRVQWGWQTFANPDTGQLHLMPLYDVGRHAFDEGCACCPVDVGTGLVHKAFDGREAYEQGRRRHH